jgi:hypothetical protein
MNDEMISNDLIYIERNNFNVIFIYHLNILIKLYFFLLISFLANGDLPIIA